MADFPALTPIGRTYSLGTYPVTTETGFGGGNVRFLHGDTNSHYELSLLFAPLTEEQATLIRDHYRAQEGGYRPFLLSPEIWEGHTETSDLTDPSLYWRYAESIQEEHMYNSYYQMNVKLVSVI